MPDTGAEQRYGPTSGTITGSIGLVACVLLAGGLAWEGADTRTRGYAFAVAAAGVLVWSFALRPRIVLTREALELRNPLSSWWIPLARVDEVNVRAITRVTVDGTGYDGIAVGRPVRQMIRAARGVAERDPGTSGRPSPGMVADLVTDQVTSAASLARHDGRGDGPVRRTWAVVELALLGVCLVGFVVCLVL